MVVNWDVVDLDENYENCARFAQGELSLRKLMNSVSSEARHELRTKVERGLGVDLGRKRLRRALQRRGYSLA